MLEHSFHHTRGRLLSFFGRGGRETRSSSSSSTMCNLSYRVRQDYKFLYGLGTTLQAGSYVFDSRWCHWNFSLISFWPYYGTWVDSASNRSEYQGYFLEVKEDGA